MLEPVEDQYEKIGYISRSHGVKGDVLIVPEIYAPMLFDTLDLVYLEDNRGDLVPARIESVRVQEKNNRLSFFVKFEHVSDRTKAEELKSRSVYAEKDLVQNLLDPEKVPLDLTSFEVIANGKLVGTVTGMLENPAHPILEVESQEHEVLLVPFVDEYIAEVDEESQKIECRNLEQLSDL